MSATDLPVSGAGVNGSGASLYAMDSMAKRCRRADSDGLLVVAMQDAGAFAEDIDGTGARAAFAEDVGVEDGLRGAFEVVAGDLLDEARDVDVRGAGGGAGRVEAVEAAIGFGHGGRVDRRADEGPESAQQSPENSGTARRRSTAHSSDRSCTPLPAAELEEVSLPGSCGLQIQVLPHPGGLEVTIMHHLC